MVPCSVEEELVVVEVVMRVAVVMRVDKLGHPPNSFQYPHSHGMACHFNWDAPLAELCRICISTC